MACRYFAGRKQLIDRAEGTLARVLMWGGLGLSALAATIYDVGRWAAIW